jgi:hypothetical protein
MVSFYETMVRQRMETAYKEKKSATLQNIADSDVGSIVGDIAKVDPEYAKEKLPNVSGSEQAVNLRERWAKMNRRKPRENQGYTPYGTPRRNDDSDDDSWT